MVRSFLPVGQGAFYCECFGQKGEQNSINIVYDCGSLTDVKIVEQEIRNNFRYGEGIEALFISHLDKDHVNGIPYLLNYCNVKRIYFPLIAAKNRKFMEIYYRAKNIDGFTFDFFVDPFKTISNILPNNPPILIQIGEAGDGNGRTNIQQEGTEYKESGDNVFNDIQDQYDNNDVVYKKWLYIPFNFRQTSWVKILLNNLENQFGEKITEEHMVQLWKNGSLGDRDKIKQAYRKVPGTFNTNSMTLFSGEIDYSFGQFNCKWCIKRCVMMYRPSGCLYMGDYDSAGTNKWKELTDAYQKYWKHIGCVQIPHHGSKHNFNRNFLKLNAFFIISAGYANRYWHPHANVIKTFLLKGIMPYIVTEQTGSAAFFVIQ